jgi:hypothetical protein
MNRITAYSLFLIFAMWSQSGLAFQTSSPLVRAEIRISPVLTEAQTISFATLGINTSGRGTRLFDLIVENLSNEPLDYLFVRVEVSSSRYGVMALLYTNTPNGFILAPNQLVSGNNNNLEMGFPGLPNSTLTEELTPAGDNFISDLGGSTTLPDAIYTVKLIVLRYAKAVEFGGNILAESVATIGARPIENAVDFFLLQPGASLGSNEFSPSRNPVFRWEGPPTVTYRLIVVEDNGQNPQSLIQGARSTEPTLGATATGTRLLDFERLDALVSGTSFVYPSSGVIQLRENTRYFWQIFARIQRGNTIEERPSEIYEFRITPSGTAVQMARIVEDISPVIRQLSPAIASRLQELITAGYNFQSLTVDGIVYEGPAILTMLEQFLARVESGQITVVN